MKSAIDIESRLQRIMRIDRCSLLRTHLRMRIRMPSAKNSDVFDTASIRPELMMSGTAGFRHPAACRSIPTRAWQMRTVAFQPILGVFVQPE
jgi:hypothetical protein